MTKVYPELDLHALTVDEAIPLLEQYLNSAFMSGCTTVRIIHGKGTGKLRQAVNKELRKHPLVKTFRLGGYGEGQTGATIVELANE